jgi:hypothetical protein
MQLLLLLFAVCLVFLAVGNLVYFPFFVYVAVSATAGVRASKGGGFRGDLAI